MLHLQCFRIKHFVLSTTETLIFSHELACLAYRQSVCSEDAERRWVLVDRRRIFPATWRRRRRSLWTLRQTSPSTQATTSTWWSCSRRCSGLLLQTTRRWGPTAAWTSFLMPSDALSAETASESSVDVICLCWWIASEMTCGLRLLYFFWDCH